MANVKVRAASLYIDGSKVAEVEGSDYDLTGGDEAQFGAEGYMGHSEGAITTKVSCNGIIPVAGMKVDIVSIFLKKKDVSISMASISGKIHKITMRCTNANVKSSHRNGTQNGSFTFEGGEPSVTG
jgi:hypothetical protein